MPKLQKHGGNLKVAVPAEIVRLLGWKPGDVVLADANKETDTVTLRRVEKNG